MSLIKFLRTFTLKLKTKRKLEIKKMAVFKKNLHSKIKTGFFLTKTLLIIKELRNYQTTMEIRIYNPLIFLLSNRTINFSQVNFKIKIKHSNNLIIIKSLTNNLISPFKIKRLRIHHMEILRALISTKIIILCQLQFSNRSVLPLAELISHQYWQVSIQAELCPVVGWPLLVCRQKLMVTNIQITKVLITLIIL